jgi:DNA-binding NarL/FixJ family response regulator
VKKTVLLVIADAHPLFRKCLVSALSADARFKVVGEGASWDEVACRAVLREADVLVLGLDACGRAGVEATRAVLEHAPEIKLLLLGHGDSDEHIAEHLQSGARGYLFRRQSFAELLVALEVVARGETACSPQIANFLFSRLSHLGRERRLIERLDRLDLTPREMEILNLIAGGLSNQAIARKLFLSVHTVKNHVHKILETLGVSSRWEAVSHARTRGWLDRHRGA